MSETIELADRVKEETTVQLVRGGGQPGPARALRPPGGGGVRRARRAGAVEQLNQLVGGDAGPLLRRPDWP